MQSSKCGSTHRRRTNVYANAKQIATEMQLHCGSMSWRRNVREWMRSPQAPCKIARKPLQIRSAHARSRHRADGADAIERTPLAVDASEHRDSRGRLSALERSGPSGLR